LKKHGVSFDEAITVFLDPFSITMPDADHSEDEERYIDLGMSDKWRVLAAFSERKFYEKGGD